VRYLALFLAGRMLDRLNQPADAEKSYVLALQVLPNVQSGVISLATKWFVAGNTDAAARLVEGSLFTQPDDPWRLFRYGDYRLLPELMKRLRLALR
jgi:predicted Zn-dependent protease